MKVDRQTIVFAAWFKAVFGLILFLAGLNSTGSAYGEVPAISITLGLISLALAFDDALKWSAHPPNEMRPEDGNSRKLDTRTNDASPRKPFDY